MRRRPLPWRFGVALVLALGLVVRAVLIPITYGQDFVVWDLATTATLHGTDIYAHHPDYPGGPYAYFPLFLYLELPFQYLAQHTVFSFTVLGKLPILAGDVLAAVVLARELRDRGLGERAVTLGTALFFLNPLLLYDSAYYGRFDSVALALLLLALRLLRTRPRGGAVWFALAVAAKTFPGFALPGVLREAGHRWRTLLVALVVIVVGQSLPYLPSWHAMLHDIVAHDAVKTPQALSWQTVLLDHLSTGEIRLFGYVLLAAFAVGTVLLLRIRDVELYVLAVLVAFLLTSKVVLEQYLVWPLPWLVLALWKAPALRVPSAVFLAVVTVVGMLTNPDVHPFGRGPAWIDVPLALVFAGYIALLVRHGRDVPAQPDRGH